MTQSDDRYDVDNELMMMTIDSDEYVMLILKYDVIIFNKPLMIMIPSLEFLSFILFILN